MIQNLLRAAMAAAAVLTVRRTRLLLWADDQAAVAG